MPVFAFMYVYIVIYKLYHGNKSTFCTTFKLRCIFLPWENKFFFLLIACQSDKRKSPVAVLVAKEDDVRLVRKPNGYVKSRN